MTTFISKLGPRAHPRARVSVTGRLRREARPQRIAQRAAGQREAEHVVFVHRIGDEAEAAPRVKQAEGWRARECMAWVRAHRRHGGLRVRDSGRLAWTVALDADATASAAVASARARASVASATTVAARNVAYVAAASDSILITSPQRTDQADLIRDHYDADSVYSEKYTLRPSSL
jgi:hypothetical protein